MLSNSDINLLSESINKIEDPRNLRLVLYPINEVIFVILCGVLSGQTSWQLFCEFGNLNIEWMCSYYPFERGIPSHDTLSRVMALLPKNCLEELLMNFSKEKVLKVEGELIAISLDGKVLARSATVKEVQSKKSDGGKVCKLIANAYCNELGLCIGAKSSSIGHECTMVSELIGELAIKDKVILTDAGNASMSNAKLIRDKEADYVLAIKNNNKITKEHIVGQYSDMTVEKDVSTSEERSRDRTEMRSCHVISVTEQAIKDKWQDCKTMVIVERKRIIKGKISKETAYFISSLMISAEKMQQLIRGHWRIENNLHWVLDVIMKEDENKSKVKNCAENLALIRRWALNLFKNDTVKRSNKAKILHFLSDPFYRDYIFEKS